jgi:DNA invertase Pin-like site-specific DNA recombinase
VFLIGFLDAHQKSKLRVGIYVRVSTAEQQTLPMQLAAIKKYVKARKWKIALEVDDIGAGAVNRKKREELMKAARRREIDAIVVWKLDRWGRSLHDLVATLQELGELQVGFVSITEALTSPPQPAGHWRECWPFSLNSSARCLRKESKPASPRRARKDGRTDDRRRLRCKQTRSENCIRKAYRRLRLPDG